MATEIARRESMGIDRNEPDALALGRVMAESGYFKDIKKAAEAAVKILCGREMGFGPAASVMGVHIIEGKPSIAAGLMASAVKRSGKYDYRITWHPDDKRPTACTVTFLQLVGGKWVEIGTSPFTWDDAQAAGLAGRQTWKSYPRNMLFARALSNGVKWYCPDVFQGAVYTPEELGADVNEDGEPLRTPARIVTTGEVMQARALADRNDPDAADYGSPLEVPPAEPPTLDEMVAADVQQTVSEVARPSERAKRADQPEADLLAEIAKRGKRHIEKEAKKAFESIRNAAEPIDAPLGGALRKALESLGLTATEARVRLVHAAFNMTPSELATGHAHALIAWSNTDAAAQEAQALVAQAAGA